MTLLLSLLLGIVFVHTTIQGLLVLGFVRALRKQPATLIADSQSPRAVVVLCLRGADPYLIDCLNSLLTQDYPSYHLHIVVDHVDDTAHEVVAAALAAVASPPATLEFLEHQRTTCSLKCSALLQVVERLDESVDFVALLDADTIAHPTWLRELATALIDPAIGVATGNRWYMPHNPSVGALVRYTWNAAAIVQMYWYQIAWGGTLAIKTSVLRETNVLQKWSHAFCEDTMLYAILKQVGLRIAFVPQLMMTNREDCRIGGFYGWVQRQLLTARLYHPAWLGVVTHGIVSTLIPVATILLAVTAWIAQEETTAGQAALLLVAYQASLVLLLLPMEGAVRRIAQARGESVQWLSPGGMLKCLAIMPLTQIVYAAALTTANFMRQTQWRGIDYRVEGAWQITMQGYQPYSPNAAEKEHPVSL